MIFAVIKRTFCDIAFNLFDDISIVFDFCDTLFSFLPQLGQCFALSQGSILPRLRRYSKQSDGE